MTRPRRTERREPSRFAFASSARGEMIDYAEAGLFCRLGCVFGGAQSSEEEVALGVVAGGCRMGF